MDAPSAVVATPAMGVLYDLLLASLVVFSVAELVALPLFVVVRAHSRSTAVPADGRG